jgi:hypothetical protein
MECKMEEQFVSFRIPKPLLEESRERAQQEDRSVSSLLRQSVRSYLEDNKTPVSK